MKLEVLYETKVGSNTGKVEKITYKSDDLGKYGPPGKYGPSTYSKPLVLEIGIYPAQKRKYGTNSPLLAGLTLYELHISDIIGLAGEWVKDGKREDPGVGEPSGSILNNALKLTGAGNRYHKLKANLGKIYSPDYSVTLLSKCWRTYLPGLITDSIILLQREDFLKMALFLMRNDTIDKSGMFTDTHYSLFKKAIGKTEKAPDPEPRSLDATETKEEASVDTEEAPAEPEEESEDGNTTPERNQ